MTEIQTADKTIGVRIHLDRTCMHRKAVVLPKTETATIPGAALGIRPVVATGPGLRAPPRQRCGPGRPMPQRERSVRAEQCAGKSTVRLSVEIR